MDSSAAITTSAVEPLITALQAQISVTTVVEVLAYVAGISIGLVFIWWAARKASRALMAAFTKGKLRL